MTAHDLAGINQEIRGHHSASFGADDVLALSQQFRREGIITAKLVPDRLCRLVRQEAFRLLDEFSERHDIRLATTDNSPRKMSTVKSELISENSALIKAIYASEALTDFLAKIARESLIECPAKDEELLITRQDQPSDTHGWHWGDFSFALIWILECPPIDAGGMLQCVPHTDWDKSNPQINRYLTDQPIKTYAFQPGDVYFLRTDTTLHRTVPLNRPCLRIILNMTWASRKDIDAQLKGNDRWWSDAEDKTAVVA